LAEKRAIFLKKGLFWLKKRDTFQPKKGCFSKKGIQFLKKGYNLNKKKHPFFKRDAFKYMIFYLGSFKYQNISVTLY